METSFQPDDSGEAFHVHVIACPVSVGMMHFISIAISGTKQLTLKHAKPRIVAMIPSLMLSRGSERRLLTDPRAWEWSVRPWFSFTYPEKDAVMSRDMCDDVS
jgi:hypothetical protein